ncbi:MAG: glutathione S-transferase N-terminal domain-containing protein [Arenicella sp.]|jgi:glutathione S-transferase|nr:glutathione S-transferase N-terminal domain-containing protein [Arenicella sp.]
MSNSNTTDSANINPVLYYSAFCYFCQKVMMFMRQRGIELETRSTSEREHAMTLREGGGKTQVPCLRIGEGSNAKWLYESDDIIRYLQANHS